MPSEGQLAKKSGPKGAWKHAPVVEAIIANEAYKGTPKYLSPRELADKFNLSPAMIYTYRTRLGMKKQIAVANNGQRHSETTTALANPAVVGIGYTRSSISTDDLVRSLEQEGIISAVDRLKMLSRLIRVGSPMIKISAIKAIEELSKTSEGRIGPPAPLTPEDRQARLIRLFLSVGEDEVDLARNAAFPSKVESEEALRDVPGGLLSPRDGPGEPVLDLSTPTAPGGGSRPPEPGDPGSPLSELQPGPGTLPG